MDTGYVRKVRRLRHLSESTDGFAGSQFHPKFFLDIFQEMNVKCVVRLNQNQYDPKVFTVGRRMPGSEHGIEVVDLFCSDGPVPSTQIIFRFIQIVERASGLVAVHCDNGLGLTGTIIGTCLMAIHDFTAREAIGWMRVMRPGSVLGMQQEVNGSGGGE
eukprot:753837-Hanusia_phi.AAC.6